MSEDTFHKIRAEHTRWENLPPEVRGIAMYIKEPYGELARDHMKNTISREECIERTLRNVFADLNDHKRSPPVLTFAGKLADANKKTAQTR